MSQINEATGFRYNRAWSEITVQCSNLHDKYGVGVACDNCPLFSGRHPVESIPRELCGVRSVMFALQNAGIPKPTL